MPIELASGAGPQRSHCQRHFYEQQGSLRMGIAVAQVLYGLVFQQPCQSRPIENLGTQ
jgi:hypothetical protein